MKIIDVIQGTTEWKEARCGIVTASNFHRIITPKTMKPSSSGFGYLCELAAESLLKMPLDDEKSQFMERGNDLELQALRYYEFVQDADTEPIGFCLHENPFIGCSPDRFVGDDGGLEIKCPSAKVHIGYLLNSLNGTLADEYKPQVQGCLWITGRKWWDVLSFHPLLPPVLMRAERDEEFIGQLEELVFDFVSRLEEAKTQIQALVLTQPLAVAS